MINFKNVYALRLATCHPELQRLFAAVNQIIPCHPIVGFRTEADQNKAFDEKKSKLRWPRSKHNTMPSMAVDVVVDSAPETPGVDIDWKNTPACYFFAGIVIAEARRLGIRIRWGGDWDSDMNLKDNSFNDLVHFELVT